MAGLAAEGFQYDKVVGQSADLFTLQVHKLSLTQHPFFASILQLSDNLILLHYLFWSLEIYKQKQTTAKQRTATESHQMGCKFLTTSIIWPTFSLFIHDARPSISLSQDFTLLCVKFKVKIFILVNCSCTFKFVQLWLYSIFRSLNDAKLLKCYYDSHFVNFLTNSSVIWSEGYLTNGFRPRVNINDYCNYVFNSLESLQLRKKINK